MTADAELTPLIMKDVACPVCAAVSPQPFLRTRLFAPGEKESDGHVLDYKWLKPNVQPISPQFYFVFYCPKCCFADLREDFIAPSDNPFYYRLTRKFTKASQKEKLILQLVARHVDSDEIGRGSAINIHLLALYAQTLLPTEACDHYKIARILLRIAWLYREANPAAAHRPVEERMPTEIESVQRILQAARLFEKSHDELLERWTRLAGAMEVRVSEMVAAPSQPDGENPYAEVSVKIAQHIKAIAAEVAALKEVCESDQRGVPCEPSPISAEPFFTFSSYGVFLMRLKGVWPMAPADEIEAIRSAIPFFEQTLQTDARFADAEKNYSLTTLIADLEVRCGEIEKAVAMVRNMYKAADDIRQRCTSQMQDDKEMPETEKRRLRLRIANANASIEKAGELRRWLLDKLMERDAPKIERILEENEGASAEATREALSDAGIAPELILRMRESGGLLDEAEKKKKRFF